MNYLAKVNPASRSGDFPSLVVLIVDIGSKDTSCPDLLPPRPRPGTVYHIRVVEQLSAGIFKTLELHTIGAS